MALTGYVGFLSVNFTGPIALASSTPPKNPIFVDVVPRATAAAVAVASPKKECREEKIGDDSPPIEREELAVVVVVVAVVAVIAVFTIFNSSVDDDDEIETPALFGTNDGGGGE